MNLRVLILAGLGFALASCETLVVNESAVVVYPVAETQPVDSSEDAADDPAIWVNSNNAMQSLVLGTDKQMGLMVYNLDGQMVQSIERGRLNNVDLRKGVIVDGKAMTLAVATNRTVGAIDIFEIDETGEISFLMAQKVSLFDPYGICMYLDQNGQAHVFANSTDGEYQQWLLNPEQVMAPVMVGAFRLGSQPEGCSVDDQTATLYLGEENVAIWTMPADSNRASEIQLVDFTDRGHLTSDVEGMEVYRSADSLYLIASSQGDNSYAVYDLTEGNRYVGSFRVANTPDERIDGSEETDGLTVSSHAFGPQYPKGMLVVQDGYNRLPKEKQNFKYVSWQDIAEVLGL